MSLKIMINGDVIVNHNGINPAIVTKGNIRNTRQFNKFKESIHKRDKVCVKCGGKSNLQVHHIMPVSRYEDLACDKGNAVLLCNDCHSVYHNRFKSANEVNAFTFAKFMRD